MINAKQARLLASTIEHSKNFKLTEEVIGELSESIEKEANLGEFKLWVIYNERDEGSYWLLNKYVLDVVSKSLKGNGYTVNTFENQIDGLYMEIKW